MKTFIFALIGLLGVTMAAPLAEARDRDHHRYSRDSRHYRDHHHRYYRDYSYRSYRPRYYVYPRYYGYDDRYYYSRRPTLSFSFGL